MRFLLGSALLIAAGAAAAPAAAQQSHGEHAAHAPAAATAAADSAWKGDLPRHFEGIALTAGQRARIVQLQHSFHARMDAVRDSAKAAGAAADAPEVQRRLGGLMAEEHQAFKALLDDAGRRRFDENMARMHGAGHGQAESQGAAHGQGQHGQGQHGQGQHGQGQHGQGQHGGHGQGHGTSGRPPAR